MEDTTEGELGRESYGEEQGKDGELAHRASTSIIARVSSPEVSVLVPRGYCKTHRNRLIPFLLGDAL